MASRAAISSLPTTAALPHTPPDLPTRLPRFPPEAWIARTPMIQSDATPHATGADGRVPDSAPIAAGGRYLKYGTLLALLLGVVLRFAWLEADPGFAHWDGYITDEGRWTEHARSLVLFGSVDFESWTIVHLVLAPAYQAVTALFFTLFGVGFTSARLVSAIAGSALLIACYLLLRRFASPQALLLGVIALALQPDMLFMSRVAIPEITAMLFQLLAFVALIGEPRTTRRAAAAGAITALALAFKATVAPVVAIFAVIPWLIRSPDDAASWVKRLLGYSLGLLVPAGLAVLLVVRAAGGVDWFSMGRVLSILQSFLQPASFYSAMAYPLYGAGLPVLGIFLMTAWIVAGLHMAAGPFPRGLVRTVFLASGFWLIAWMGVSALLAYFPARYVLHAVVPATLHITAGLTLLQQVGFAAVLDFHRRIGGWQRVMLTAWISLPAGVVLAALSVAMLSRLGVDLERLTSHLATIALLVLLISTVALGARKFERFTIAVSALPVAFALTWLLATRSGFIQHGLWKGAEWTSGATLALVAATAGLTWLAVVTLHDGRRVGAAYGCVVAVVAGVWLSWNVAGLIPPERTAAETSRQLEHLLTHVDTVGSWSASTLFLGNRLRFAEVSRDGPMPDVMVVSFRELSPDLLERYSLVKSYPVRVGASYLAQFPSHADIRVYERVR